MKISHNTKLDKLPFKENRAMNITRRFGDMYNLKKFDYPAGNSERSKDPWVIAGRVVKSYKGKQFDKAFSYYCSLVDFQYQYCFFQEFEERRWWHYKWYGYYYIDKVGNIQYRKPKTRNNPKRSAKEYYEILQAQRKAYKLQKKAKLEKEYSMLTREEAKDKHESMIKLISHGFDPKTSFRNN